MNKLQQITDRLTHLEREVEILRRELAALRRQSQTTAQESPQSLADFPRIDKTALQQAMDDLFEALSIRGNPIGAKALQKMMAKANLEQNELSRAIIDARET